MKEFNGTIVIIDPEKFAKPEDLGRKIDTKLTRISPKLGFKGLFFTELGYPRYFMSVHRVVNAKEYYSTGVESWVKKTIQDAFNGQIPPRSYAKVSVDSGSVGVFLLSDIQKYNPGALDSYKVGEDYLLIENYKGKIGHVRDKYGIIHFYGTGTQNFFTL